MLWGEKCWQSIPAKLFRMKNLSCPKLQKLDDLISCFYFLSTCWPCTEKVCPGGQWTLLVGDVDPGSHEQHWRRQILYSAKGLPCSWEEKSQYLALKPILHIVMLYTSSPLVPLTNGYSSSLCQEQKVLVLKIHPYSQSYEQALFVITAANETSAWAALHQVSVKTEPGNENHFKFNILKEQNRMALTNPLINRFLLLLLFA